MSANRSYRTSVTGHYLLRRKVEENDLATCFRATLWFMGLTRFRTLGSVPSYGLKYDVRTRELHLFPPNMNSCIILRNLHLPCTGRHIKCLAQALYAYLPTQQVQALPYKSQNCQHKFSKLLLSCVLKLRILILTNKCGQNYQPCIN